MTPRSLVVAGWSLVKPRIVGLLLLTGVSGAAAAGGLPAPTFVLFVLAGAGIAAGSAALNCYYDRRLDRRMARTADRPLARGTLPSWSGLALGIALLGAGTTVAWYWLPRPSLVFMLLGALAYVGLYTVGLKRYHHLATPIGGLAGAFPVLAGWAVVDSVGAAAIGLAALVVAWTPAHAWALAFVYRDEFRAAGVPTLPAVAGTPRVQRSVWRWAWLTVGVALLVVPTAGPLYAAAVVGGVGPYLLAFNRFRRDGSTPAAVRAFFTANLFLAVTFLGRAADGLIGQVSLLPAAGIGIGVSVLFLGLWSARPSLRRVEAATGIERRLIDRLHGTRRVRRLDG